MSNDSLADNILNAFTARKGRGETPEPHWSHEEYTKRIPLLEMFGPTIEGEGAVIGEQVFFLRVAGCDYKCKLCDSLHAVLPQHFGPEAHYLTPHQIAEAMHEFAIRSKSAIRKVVLTGGNPAMYDFEPCIKHMRTLDPKWEFLVETQGTFCPDWFGNCDHVTVSPKGPGFGEKFEPEKYLATMEFLDHNVMSYNTKIVVFDKRDLMFAEQVADLLVNAFGEDYYKFCPVFLSVGNNNTPTRNVSPEIGHDEIVQTCLQSYRIILEELKDHPKLADWRVLPQMHVLLWANKAKV